MGIIATELYISPSDDFGTVKHWLKGDKVKEKLAGPQDYEFHDSVGSKPFVGRALIRWRCKGMPTAEKRARQRTICQRDALVMAAATAEATATIQNRRRSAAS